MLKGALGLKDALVINCMTEMKDVFWLNDQKYLNLDILEYHRYRIRKL